MKTWSRSVLAASVLGLSGLAQAELVDRVAAVVNKDIIALSEVQQRAAPELTRIPSDQDAKQRAALRRQILESAVNVLIGEKLMEAEVKELGIHVSDAELEAALDDVQRQNNITDTSQFEQMLSGEGYTIAGYRDFLRKQLSKMKLVQMKVTSKIKISEEDLQAEYKRYTRMEGEDSELHARHILVQVPPGASPEQVEAALTKAKALAEEARRPGVNFEELAKRKSEGPSAADGGDLGFFRRGVMLPAFDKAAFALKDGEVSEPVRSSFGFHVITVVERRSVDVKPFEEVKAEIAERMRRQRTEKLVDQYVRELRQKATVEVKI